MKQLYLASLMVGFASMAAAQTSSPPVKPQMASPLQQKLEFIQNKGQWDKRVRFLGHAPGVDMWITDTGITYAYHKQAPAGAKTPTKDSVVRGKLALSPLQSRIMKIQSLSNGEKSLSPMATKLIQAQADHADQPKTDVHVVRISFVGASDKIRTDVSGFKRKSYTYNYYEGKDKSKWISNVPVFEAATLKGLYKGIDLVAYFDEAKKMPRYDLVVKPGADASQIAMRYEGANDLHMTPQGTVAYQTSLGKIEERDMLAYQPTRGFNVDQSRKQIAAHDKVALTKVKPVQAKMTMSKDGLVRLALGQRDPSVALVIDPLVWSTFIGGSNGYSGISAVAVGGDGSSYIVGRTSENDFPTTPGAYQTTSAQSFLARLSSDGTTILYGTYITDVDLESIAIQSNGTVVAAGRTIGSSYPQTAGSYGTPFAPDPESDPGNSAVVMKFSPDGSSLAYSAVMGAIDPLSYERNSVFYKVQIDGDGAAYLFGSEGAGGSEFSSPGSILEGPAIPQGYDSGAGIYHPGQQFCVKLNPTGSALEWGTYFQESVSIYDLSVDANHNVYVGGSAKGIAETTAGAFRGPDGIGPYTGFLRKIHANGASYVYEAAINGTSGDLGSVVTAIAIDSDGNAYVSGVTDSFDLPVTPGAYDSSLDGILNEAAGPLFFAKLTPDGANLAYCTYFESSDGLFGVNSLAVDQDGSLFFSGAGLDESQIPTTIGAYQRTVPSVDSSLWGFAGKLSGDAASVPYLTYFGGSSDTFPNGMAAIPGTNTIYLVGEARSFDYPTTLGSFKPMPNIGESSGFITKLNMAPEASISFSPTKANGAAKIIGTYYLPGYAATNTPVTLQSSSPLVKVPSAIVVPAGQISVDFPIVTKFVDAPTLVEVRAVRGSTITKRNLGLDVPVITNFALSTEYAVGGNRVTGTVNLSGPAGPDGFPFQVLAFGDKVVVPESVVVPAGKLTARFTIVARDNGSRTNDTIYVHGDQGRGFYQFINLTPASLSKGSLGATALFAGNKSIGKVTLDSLSPVGGVTIDLNNNKPDILIVPTTVVIPEGQNYATFDVQANPAFSGDNQSATVLPYFARGDSSPTIFLPMLIKAQSLTKMSLAPATLYGGYTANLILSLAGPAPDGGAAVALSSDCVGFPVPATVTIPAGAATASFPLTVPVSFAGPSKVVTVQATAFGATRSARVTVRPITLSLASVAPSTVKGGVSTTLTVTMSNATSVPVTVTLSSDSASAAVPATIVIPAGALSATVPVTTQRVTTATTVYIGATLNGLTKTVKLVVNR